MDIVKSAALTYAKTEVEDEGLHPECLVTTMSHAHAEEWQARLRDTDDEQRCAERAVLLAQYLAKQLDKRKVGGCHGRPKRSHRKIDQPDLVGTLDKAQIGRVAS